MLVGADSLMNNTVQGKGVLGSLLVEGTSADSNFQSLMVNLKKYRRIKIRNFQSLMQNLNEISEESKSAISSLSENMEALKHNWLFKSYFEERGYWDAVEYEEKLTEKQKS